MTNKFTFNSKLEMNMKSHKITSVGSVIVKAIRRPIMSIFVSHYCLKMETQAVSFWSVKGNFSHASGSHFRSGKSRRVEKEADERSRYKLAATNDILITQCAGIMPNANRNTNSDTKRAVQILGCRWCRRTNCLH